MSDLRPRGQDIVLPELGERNFLFDLNVIDAIQDKYKDKNIFEVFDMMLRGTIKEQNNTLRTLVQILLDDERERKLWRNPNADIEPVTRKQVGWLIDVDNMEQIKIEILRAYRISIPETPGAEDDEDDNDDPNL